MNDTPILKLLTTPLDRSFAIVLILAGLYSLIINSKLETKQNYIRSAKLARIAGWSYIIAGAGILVMQ